MKTTSRLFLLSAALATFALLLSGGCKKKKYVGIPILTSTPAQASNPTPADGAVDILLLQTLDWDNAGNAETYSVYFGTSSPGAFQGNQTDTGFDPGVLSTGTRYYWRINTHNQYGTTYGVVWSFTTGELPAQASNPVPADGETRIPLNQQLSWDSVAGADEYAVYFGTSSTPSLIGCQSGITYDPGALAEDTSYYWRIHTVNQYGATLGPLWSFRTNTIPGTVTNLAPADGATQVSL
ncbi:MAG: hypothetical protein ACYS8W_20760, partial [Planctomycetota bacterium]